MAPPLREMRPQWNDLMTVQEKIKADLPNAQIPDDMAMLRAAVELTRDISAARPGIYCPDMLISAAVGYAGIAGAILLSGWQAWAAGVIAVLPLEPPFASVVVSRSASAVRVRLLAPVRVARLPMFALVLTSS